MGVHEESLEDVLDRRANETIDVSGAGGRILSRADNPSSRECTPTSRFFFSFLVADRNVLTTGRSTLRSGLPSAGIMLTPISPDASVKAPEDDSEPTSSRPAVDEEDNQWLVDHIVKHRTRYFKRPRKPETQYLVRWLGYGEEDDQWVREQDIDPALIQAYSNRKASKPSQSLAAGAAGEAGEAGAAPQLPKKRGRPPKHSPVSQATAKLGKSRGQPPAQQKPVLTSAGPVVTIPPPAPLQPKKRRKRQSLSPSSASYRSPRVLYRRLSGKTSDLAT
jgi:hypothetical protein